MSRIRTTLLTFLITLLVFSNLTQSVKAQTNNINVNNIPNGDKLISLRINKRPLSHAIKKIAQKAKLNIVISPDFNDGKISVDLKDTSTIEALYTLMDVGNFTLEENNGIIVARNKVEPEIMNDVISLDYAQASRISQSISNSVDLNEHNSLSFDDMSNSILVQGDDKFIYNVKNLVSKMDLPRKNSTFKLKNYTSNQVKTLLETMVFHSGQDNSGYWDSQKTLSPAFDQELGYVIKGIIEKQDLIGIKAEKPIIIPENEGNAVTVIGNSHQISLTKDIIEYLEGKQIDKDEEIRLSHQKLYETKQELETAKDQIKELQLELADSAVQQVETDIELKETKEQTEKLNEDIANLKSQNMWNLLLPKEQEQNSERVMALEEEIETLKAEIKSNKQKMINGSSFMQELAEELETKTNQLETANKELNELKAQLSEYEETKELARLLQEELNDIKSHKKVQKIVETRSEAETNKIAVLEEEINRLRTGIAISKSQLVEKSEHSEELEKQLLDKDKELAVAFNELKDLRAQLAELKLTKTLGGTQGSLLVAQSLEELSNTKTQLNKVKRQLEDSKKQLELIFGGKLLDESILPDNKSQWF